MQLENIFYLRSRFTSCFSLSPLLIVRLCLVPAPLPCSPGHLIFLTQTDFLPRVGRQQEDQQGHGGEEHTGDEEVESVEQGPSA